MSSGPGTALRRLVPVTRHPSANNGATAGREMPASEEAEQHVLACCLLDGSDTLVRCIEARLSPDSFYWPENQIIFLTLLGLHQKEKTITLAVVAEEMTTQRTFNQIGGFPYLMQVTGKIPTTAHAGYFIEKVREKQLLREMIKAATGAVEDAYGFTGGLTEFMAAFREKMEAFESPGTFQAEDMAGLIAKPPPKPKEVIKGLLYESCKLIIGAPSKARKSYGLIDLAEAVATGTTFWQWECDRGPVAYVNFELHKYFVADRARHIAESRGHVLEKGMIDTFNLRGQADDIELLRPMLLRTLTKRKYRLIIFDPYYSMLGRRDENNAGDMNSMMNEFEKIACVTGSAVAFSHHFSKGNKAGAAALDRMSGSGVLARNPDTILTMTEHAEQDCYSIEAGLRYHKPLDKFTVRWNYPRYEVDSTLDPDNLKQANTGRRTETTKQEPAEKPIGNYEPSEILRYFPPSRSSAMEFAKIYRRAAEACGISSATFSRVRLKLIKADLIKQTSDDRYIRTAAGDATREQIPPEPDTQSTIDDL